MFVNYKSNVMLEKKKSKPYIPPNPLKLRYVDYSLSLGLSRSVYTTSTIMSNACFSKLYAYGQSVASNDISRQTCVNCISTYGHPSVPANP